MKKAVVIDALAALAHPIRLDVFRALVVAGPDGLTPGVLVDKLDVPPTKLSFHLKELAGAGLVTQEQAGRTIIYRASYKQMDALLGYLTDNCCQGAACGVGTSACKA
jgi:DNA-binding transcriptional ArsR family regulator